MAPEYTVTIEFSYGRDKASRRVVSTHTSPTAAARAWVAARTDTGWCPRIECADEAARERLLAAARTWDWSLFDDAEPCLRSAIVRPEVRS